MPTDLAIKALDILAAAPEGLTERDFSERLFPNASPGPGSRRSAGTLLGKLEKAGQVKLGYDARRWVYRITAAGKAILAQHEAQIVAQDASATGVPASVRRMLE
jgi:hypothetical protein